MIDNDGGMPVPDWAVKELKQALAREGVLEGHATITLPPLPPGMKWVLEKKRRFDGPLIEAHAE